MFAYTKLMQAMAAAGVVSATDPYFNLTTLLLPGNGTNGAQNNTFLDSSTNNFTITRNGNTTQGTFSPFSQTGWGNYFGGDGNYITAPYNAAFDYGTGDFSVECFAYIADAGRGADSSKYGTLLSGGAASSNTNLWNLGFLITSGVISSVFFDNGGSNVLTASSQSISLNAWHHFVLCRTGTTLSIFVDGTRIVTATYSTAINTNSSGNVQIARSAYGSIYQNWASGYFSNVRIVKGTQPYNAASSTITQPTATLTAITNTSLLTCQSNRFLDNSSNAFAITVNGTPSVQAFSPFAPTAAYSAATNGGSGYFDGAGDYLTVADTTSLEPGTGDFCFETWVYHTSASNGSSFDFYTDQLGGGLAVYRNLSNKIQVDSDGVVALLTSASNVPFNSWAHIAVTRSGTTLRIFLNGVVDASTTNSTNIAGTSAISYGGQPAGGSNLDGYLASTRFVKGSAVYTSGFSVPTAPLTAISGTQILLNYTNAGITDATAKNDLETVGNAQISTTQSKFGGSSMYFDGTGDYLLAPASPNNNLNIGDFTLEFWIYRANLTGDVDIVGCGNVSTTGYQVRIKGTTGYVQFLVIGGATITTTTGISATTWTHIAIVRSGTTVKIYINGTDGGGSGTVGNSGTVTTELLVVGANRYDYSNTLNGYIDDLRITKGYARYTANFTAPTAAFALQ